MEVLLDQNVEAHNHLKMSSNRIFPLLQLLLKLGNNL